MKLKRGRRRAPLSTRDRVIRALGVALIVSGIGLLGVSYWQTTLSDELVASKQTALAEKFDSGQTFVDTADADALGEIFGRIYIPRLGDGYVRLVAEGTKWHPVLNDIGIGHYMGTAFPGEVGNFAVAAHRGGYGGAFKNIHRLVAGDHVFVETNDGRFDYEYRQTVIVKPEDVGVIAPVPEGMDSAVVGGSYMTLTSCEPIYVNTKRIIVWLELVGVQKR